ncbi:ABC transporter permease family protein [Sediminibacterium soli]|uniref:hypothetical protein n=1 Tax=Sediminibacterium soli TaxID=2698829 RepID=UPI0013796581|nr:hypothetical protein [Sediminibacterium soli]NCI47620.1 hypothetical protein [Sediminibacterium soli]
MQLFNKLLKKLIRTGRGRRSFLMASIGLSIAMLLILAAVQIQENYHELLYSKSNQDSVANFLVLNKELTDRNLGATALERAEITGLRNQSFVESVGILTASRFKASIQSRSDRFPFFTDIAFESVPKEFLDVNSKEWKWEPGEFFVPIIAPNMFLDFYNFQFSFSQNLPQLTQEIVKMIGFTVNVYDAQGKATSFTGRVVGFSDRISSLLVPQEFMDWANGQFAQSGEAKPSRVIVRTKDPGNPELVQYLQQNGLTTDADKTRFSRYRQVVTIVVRIAWITGVVMFAFAMLVFTLFIQLTIASSKDDISLLIGLGTSPRQLQRFLMRQFFPANIWIICVALLAIGVLQYLLHGWLVPQHVFIKPIPSPVLLVAAVLVLLVIWLVNLVTIKNYTRQVI